MKVLRFKIVLLLLLSYGNSYLYSQTLEEQMSRSHPDCRTMLMNAMDVLPGLYRAKSLDSLEKAIVIWERSCYGEPEVSITRMLLDMEEDKFSFSQHINTATIDLLSGYANDFPSPARSDAPKNSFYKFSSAWAGLLLKNQNLDENEIFICKVITGNIKNPRKEIEKNRRTYPELAALLNNAIEAERKEPRADLALSTGVWIPTGNLSTLGIHPSFGFHAGIRNMHQQLDLTMQIRYLQSANPYAVKRGGQLDSTDYYLGGYIGLDYNYYLVSKPKYEFGLLAGIGWDGFDFAPDPYNYYYYEPYYTSHVTIGSFNANAGLRFNYFVTHSFYIGLQARYNAIQYSTGGGTNLSGNAFSIDLIFGSNSSKY